MSPTGWILFVIVGIVTALNPAPYRTNEESLRGALNVITRKQRSLDLNSREFYNDLHSFKYRGDNDRKLERQREENDFDEDEEELEFLPLENGQLETIGEGFRNINEKQLERALADFIKSESIQEEPVSSLFRERERSASIKRGASRNDRPNADDEELARLFLEELDSGSPYGQDELDDTDYYNTLQMLHRPQQENRPYGNDGLMPWGDFAEKKPLRERIRDDDQMEYLDRDQVQDLYLVPLERRNVNGRYPLGQDLRSYREISKRFPVAKRSAKAVSKPNQATDPKVAQDLGSLFGTQSSEKHNHTHEHRGHDHDHDHDHDHNHDHEHDHAHQHESEVHGMSGHNHEVTSAAPSVTFQPKGQKGNMTKTTKSKQRSIEVKKKSVNWSDYFGIDRRKKKSTFLAKPGSQDQDDEWFLERYYKTMSENLKPENEREGGDKKDKLQQMDSRLKNIKDLIIEEALNADGEDIQEIKDKVMSRLAAAYSLEKMRRALKEFRDSIIIQRERQKSAHPQDSLTTNRPEDSTGDKSEEKRSQGVTNMEGFNGRNSCPELDLIEKRCKVAGLLAHDIKHVLHGPCVSAQICRSCGDQDCFSRFAMEVAKACESQEIQQSVWTRDQCFEAATLIPLNPPASAVALCHSEGRESCLVRYFYRNRQRNSYPHDLHHRNNFDNIVSPQR